MTVEYIRKQNHDSTDMFFFRIGLLHTNEEPLDKHTAAQMEAGRSYNPHICVHIYTYDPSMKLLKDRYVYEHRDTLKKVESES